MAVFKQLLVTVVVLAVAGAVWVRYDPRPGQYLLTSSHLPDPLRAGVAWLSASDDSGTADRANPPASNGPRSSTSSAGAARRGGRAAPLVVVDAVVATVTRNRLKAIGTGEAVRSVVVHPEATGIVREVRFKSGDEVEAGTVLATLENDTEALAVDRAKIAVEAAEAKLQRYRRLQNARTVAAVELEDVQREVDNAKLDVRGAELALAKRNIAAPIAGRVGIVTVDTGDLVSNDTTIATIDDRSSLRVVFYVPEGFVPEVDIGHPVEATSVANPSEIYRGTVTAVDSRLDEASRTLKVEASIENPSDTLRPGMSFSLNLGFEGDRYLSVDPLSVQWERAGPFVWKVAGDEGAKVPVRIIERNVDRVLVSADDLALGDPVVVEGQQAIRPGVKLRIEPRPKTEAPAPAGTTGVPQASRETPREDGSLGRLIGSDAAAAELPSDAAAAPGAR